MITTKEAVVSTKHLFREIVFILLVISELNVSWNCYSHINK